MESSSYNKNQTIMPTEDEIYNLSFAEALEQICSTCITPIMKRKDPALYNAAVVVQNQVEEFEKISHDWSAIVCNPRLYVKLPELIKLIE